MAAAPVRGCDKLVNEPAIPSKHKGNQGTPARRRQLWPWFLAGFATVFVGISLTLTAYTMHPSGRGLIATPLWRYYITEGKRAMSSSSLGPASSSFAAVIAIALQHALCSFAGGAVVAGTVWAARRFRAHPRM